ncbi:MAG: DEAD/DEAH box helicase [Planctomycetes bacterium]|nr:DEAD/DEAH box helicase [Planctomycetota bacterium]
MEYHGLKLDPFQELAIQSLETGHSVLVSAPTGAGKTLIAEYTLEKSLNENRRVIYTAPIKAPLHIKIVALGATVPNINQIAHWIRSVRKSALVVIEESCRPVPLKHKLWLEHFGVANLKDLKRLGREPVQHRRPRQSLIEYVVSQQQTPILYFLFNRRECERYARSYSRLNLLSPAEQVEINKQFNELSKRFEVSGDDFTALGKLVSQGIAYHHAGMLPTLKEIVEQLFTAGLIKLLFATETFAVGVNMPARTVVFDTAYKFDGIRRNPLKTRDYQQMAGRAGRRGIDREGFVYLRLDRPYPRPSVVEQITSDKVEEVKSQFNLSYNGILNLYQTLGENIYQACQKSLSNFQISDRRAGKKHQAAHGKYHNVVNQLKRKLSLLYNLGYLQNRKLTAKGNMARQINSYELLLTEFISRDILEHLNANQINLLLVALVFEPRRGEWYEKPAPELWHGAFKTATQISNNLRTLEKKGGIMPLTKPIEFKLSAAVDAWSSGEMFANLVKYTSASDGDLIRTFRMAIQSLRQLLHLSRQMGLTVLTEKLTDCVDKLRRDEVDPVRDIFGGADALTLPE